MRFFLAVLAICAVASTCAAEMRICANGLLSIEGTDANLSDRLCRVSDSTLAHFDACGLGQPPTLSAAVVDTLPEGCLGLYHCSDQRIELLAPAALDTNRGVVSWMRHLPSERIVELVLVHEMAHALFATRSCRFGTCTASSEYFAHTIQIAAMTLDERAPFEATIDFSVAPSPEAISDVMYYLSPERFAQLAWHHFSSRDRACEDWRAILDGSLRFDTGLK